MTKLYHKEVFLPVSVRAEAAKLRGRLTLSKHALREAMNDRYGHVTLPREVEAAKGEIIEVEYHSGLRRVLKAVVRFALDAARDIVMVLCPDGPGALFVKTVWINERNDQHGTLDRSKYAVA